jgi:hypothetical protein
MLKIQETCLRIAKMNQRENDALHIASRQRQETVFPINSYVLVAYENGKQKMNTHLHGPYRVISKQGAVYTVQNLVTNQLLDYHASLIKEFTYNETYDKPEIVARMDNEEKGILNVLEHKWKYKKQKLSNLQLLYLSYGAIASNLSGMNGMRI